jgi:hypothetical protein
MKPFIPHFLYLLAKIHTAYETQAFGAGNCFAEGISKFLSSHRCNAICHYLNLPPTSQPSKQSSEGSTLLFFLLLFSFFDAMFHLVLTLSSPSHQVAPLLLLVSQLFKQPVDLRPRILPDRTLQVVATTRCMSYTRTKTSFSCRECAASLPAPVAS